MRSELQVRGGGVGSGKGRTGATICLITSLCAPLRYTAFLPAYTSVHSLIASLCAPFKRRPVWTGWKAAAPRGRQ